MSKKYRDLICNYYHKDACCPKCNNNSIEDTFIGGGEKLDIGTAQEDNIRRVCENCNYTWYVKPVDVEDYPEELRDE